MNNNVLVIIGSTATKKTSVAVSLAQQLNGEIINCDAFQVYKELNVGINKPSLEIQNKVKFHLLNKFSIYDEFNIAIFQKEVFNLIEQIIHKNKLPILCGGSNLYIDCILKNYYLSKYPNRDDIHYFDNWTYEQIYQYVYDNDKSRAQKIGIHNQVRIIRAAQQIWCDKQLNQTKINQNNLNKYNFILVETFIERTQLYEKINNRVDEMINNGWIDEVNSLYQKDKNIGSLNAFKAIGYKQILDAIVNNYSVNVDKIKQLSRRYAKRQTTWINNKYQNRIIFKPQVEKVDDLIKFLRTLIII